MITIKEAKTKKEITEFVKFPFKLFQDNPYWIPPLISEEVESFDKQKNPAFETAEAYFYLAYKNGKSVGRISAIINWTEVNDQQKRKVRFGWFDTIDDIEVTKALLEKAYELGRKHHLDNVEGPMGFSNLDKVGVLTEGFDELGTMITWYSPKYYMEHFERLGFVKEKQFMESRFKMPVLEQVTQFLKGDELIRKRYGLTVINPTSTKEILPYIDRMFDLFNLSYAKLSSFVAISERQKQYFKDKYIGMINPAYIKFVEDSDGRLVGFSIVMPSLSKALKKANGKLFPFGFLYLLWAKKHSKEVLFYLIGVHPEYMNKGVTAVIMAQYFRSFNDNGVKDCVRTPELEENHAIHNLWKNFNPVVHKRRCTYIKDL
jgi:GNAT superfamily N-acetyltransferase